MGKRNLHEIWDFYSNHRRVQYQLFPYLDSCSRYAFVIELWLAFPSFSMSLERIPQNFLCTSSQKLPSSVFGTCHMESKKDNFWWNNLKTLKIPVLIFWKIQTLTICRWFLPSADSLQLPVSTFLVGSTFKTAQANSFTAALHTKHFNSFESNLTFPEDFFDFFFLPSASLRNVSAKMSNILVNLRFSFMLRLMTKIFWKCKIMTEYNN